MQAKVGELSRQILEQRETIASLEREVLAYKADRDKMVTLERQLSSIHGDSSSEVSPGWGW